jgi:hypothetical protein
VAAAALPGTLIGFGTYLCGDHHRVVGTLRTGGLRTGTGQAKQRYEKKSEHCYLLCYGSHRLG